MLLTRNIFRLKIKAVANPFTRVSIEIRVFGLHTDHVNYVLVVRCSAGLICPQIRDAARQYR